MPESVTDRCTKSHEYIFLLSKSAKYYYDNDAIAEKSLEYGKDKRSDLGNIRYEGKRTLDKSGKNGQDSFVTINQTRNKRSVWTINTKPYKDAHFAVFPPKIPELCIKAGTSEYGECSECGKAWERVTERITQSKSSVAGEKTQAKRGQGLVTQFSGYEDGSKCPNIRTTGWKPSCSCDADRVPQIVLDPFFGSGTTGWVAQRLGRKWIGIELNEEYIKIAEKRFAQQEIFV
jgi:hypothetical protein